MPLLAALVSPPAKGVMYSTYEKFGVYKRDLLEKRVGRARRERARSRVHTPSCGSRK
jgi:hypothetical protein